MRARAGLRLARARGALPTLAFALLLLPPFPLLDAAWGARVASEGAPPPVEPVPLDLPTDVVRAPNGKIGAFEPVFARFPLRVDGSEMRFAVQAVQVVAGETLKVAAPPEVRLMDRDGEIFPESPGLWVWRAPAEPGIVPLRAEGPQGRVDLNVLVLVPASEVKDGMLNGYRIGRYVQDVRTGNPVYAPPEGFAQVRPEDEDVLVSPHFTLGQLLCKDPGDPRYLVLSVPLVLKLEAILAAVNRSGIRVPTLQFVSGYRTPAYNRAIGNTTTMSRHLYGDAADIYVDSTGDGKMDDLNKDGRVDAADALALVRIIEGVERADGMVRPGGVGLYPPVPGRGPFVHVDARGTPARW